MLAAVALCAAVQSAQCGAEVAGRFNDRWGTGNRPPGADTSWFGTAADWHTHGGGWRSGLRRASRDKKSSQCFYTATSVCVRDGALALYADRTDRPDPWLRLCNDLRSKIRVRFEYLPPEAAPPHPLPSEGSDVPAHVVSCWQLYGYHLHLCLLAAWYVQKLHGVGRGHVWVWNHAASLAKSVREHFSMSDFYGSPSSWNGTRHPQSKLLGFKDSTYWGLWQVLAANPSRVRKLLRPGGSAPASPGSTCYRRAILGIPSPAAVPEHAKRAFTEEIWGRFGVRPAARVCGRYRMLVAVRSGRGMNQGLRTVANAAAVVGVAGRFGVAARTLSFEDVPLREQVAAAASSDIFLSTHGAGNMWATLMAERSVLIEAWPDYPRRLVYVKAASGWNLRYYHVSQGVNGAGYMEQSVTVPPAALSAVLADAVGYLNATACCAEAATAGEEAGWWR
eukprot:TRINITY_DN6036_c2_g1_i1.p1 TRINITY_DN6036_c2_g1~~TRINITY_DN6036_c2_g1_i1.p1  ORF type:complete len:471 (+),score=128.61 TRINITY_DN6036_c2_g1_i1:69-1415(+)